MKNTRIRLNLQILLAIITLFGVHNAFAQESRYSNSSYKIAFQPPSGSTKNAESTERRIIFSGETGKSGVPPRLELVVDDSPMADEISQMLGTEKGLDLFISGAIKGFKEEMGEAEFDIKEKKRIQMLGLNAVKIVAAVKYSGIKMRFASFSVIVPQHKRMYNFIVIALEKDFEKWLPLAQASIDSFELMKTIH